MENMAKRRRGVILPRLGLPWVVAGDDTSDTGEVGEVGVAPRPLL